MSDCFLKASGVSHKNWQKEIALDLWNRPITYEQAVEISDWVCSVFDLERVNIKFGKSKKMHGTYEPRNGTRLQRIFIYPIGQSLATLFHELGHHYSYTVLHKSGHKKEFEQSHSLMLDLAERWLTSNE